MSIGFYGQDTWRFTDRLTLNLGLRYDAHTPWVEANNQQANYNFATGNIDLAGQNGASRGLYDGSWEAKISSLALVSPGLLRHWATKR